MPGFLRREYKIGSAIWLVQRSIVCMIEFRMPNLEYFIYRLITRKFNKKSTFSKLKRSIDKIENPDSITYSNPKKAYHQLIALSEYYYNRNEFTKCYEYLRKARDIKTNDSILKKIIRVHQQLGNTSQIIECVNQLTGTAKNFYMAELEKALDEKRLDIDLWAPGTITGEIVKGRNIVHVLNKSWDHSLSGYTIRSREIAMKQKTIGLKPVVVTKLGSPGPAPININNKFDSNKFDSLQIDGIDITHIYDKANSQISQIPLSRYFDRYAATFYNYLQSASPAIIHTASNFQNALPALQVAKSAGIASVYEVRGLWHITREAVNGGFGGSESYNFQDRYEIYCCNIADSVIVLSEHLKDYLISKGIDKARIDVIPNGVDADYFNPVKPCGKLIEKYDLKNCFVFGFIGSLTDYEGLDYLLEAFKAVLANHVKSRLLIVGDGDAAEKLKNMSAELELNNEVIFTGRVPFEEVRDYYSVIDVFPYPRLDKRVCHLVPPLKPLEAMAMEKVVLASNVGVLREMVIDNENGMVFEAESVESLAEAMLNSMNAWGIGIKSRQWIIKNRDWKKLIYRYVDVYKKLGLESPVIHNEN